MTDDTNTDGTTDLTDTDTDTEASEAEQGSRWRVTYTRHDASEYLQRHLARREQRRADRAATPPWQRRRRRRRALFGTALAASLACFGGMGLYANGVTRSADDAAQQLRLQIAALPTRPPTTGTTQSAPTGIDTAKQQLAAARAAAGEVTRIQTRMGALLLELNSSEDDDDERANPSEYDSAAMLSRTNALRQRLAGMFDQASLTWADERMYSWASVWALATQDADPRLLWSIESAEPTEQGGCRWSVQSVSAESLVGAEGAGVSVLWYCLDSAKAPRAFATARYDTGTFHEFQARQLKIEG